MGKNFKPEICYPLIPLNMEEIQSAMENDETITGYVEEIYPNDRYLSVRLHQDIFAVLPYSEVSIYENAYVNSENYKKAVLLKGKNIRIKVTKIDGINIFVSRKRSMEQALKHLKGYNDLVTSHVYYITRHFAVADIGSGVIGYLPIKELTTTYIKSINEYISRGSVLKLKLLSFNIKNEAILSYCKAFCKIPIQIGSLVDCSVKMPVDDIPSGYFVSLTPAVSGIVDKTFKCPDLLYGDRIQCIVVDETFAGLKLRFVKMLHSKRS